MVGSVQPLQSGLTLHIWPGRWDLPSFDPLCLAAVLYLQLAVPGQFSIIECSNPDVSPTGQLPFLVHDQHAVASFPSIVKYVSCLQNAEFTTYPKANLDSGLSQRERSQRTAWHAHAESHLGDLVYHYLYSNQENWEKLTGTALASMFPVPQKYYVPRRIRDSYHERLLAAGLWKEFSEEPPTESHFPRDVKPSEIKKEEITKNPTLARAFEREKIAQKVQAELDIYQHLLGGKRFIFQHQPSSVDVLVAAHILLLANPPYPDALIKNLVIETYPALLSHAQHIFNEAFLSESLPLRTSSSSHSLWDVIPSWTQFGHVVKEEPTPEEIKDKQIRWGFIGLVLGSFVAYLAIVPKSIIWQNAEVYSRDNGVHPDSEDAAIQ